MTTEPLSLDNGFHTGPKARPVVIQVHELPITSPTGDKSEEVAQEYVNVVGKVGDVSLEKADAIIRNLSLSELQTGHSYSSKRSLEQICGRRSSLGSVDGEEWEFGAPGSPVQRLPTHFADLGAAQLSGQDNGRRHSTTATYFPSSAFLGARPNSLSLEPEILAQSWLQPNRIDLASLKGPSGVVPPLTPPDELGPFKWDTVVQTDPDCGVRTVSNVGQNQPRGQSHQRSRNSSTSRPSEIQMPARSSMGQDESSRPNWLGRVCQLLGMYPYRL